MRNLGLRLHADEEHWIPLSDLMTGLMFLFLLISLAYMVAIQVQQTKTKDVLQTYEQTRTDLYRALYAEFHSDLPKWGAQLDPQTLSLRFYARNVLFTSGSSELQPRFQAILRDFFPRYVRILTEPQYRDLISEVRIEGYTSSFWQPGATIDQSYIGNMALSQDRTRAVLAYVLGLPAIEPDKSWLLNVLTANGLSFSHLIRYSNGTENADASQRVEFRVRTDADRQVARVLALSATPTPAPIAANAQQPNAPAALANVPIVSDPRPAFPAWADGIVGKPLKAVYANRKSSQCLGYFDGVKVQYAGTPPGAELYGWGYDQAAKSPVSRVVLSNPHGIIVGAAEGGLPRPDVPAALPQVSSTTTGWQGYVTETAPPIAAWGLIGTPPGLCRFPASPTAASQGM